MKNIILAIMAFVALLVINAVYVSSEINRIEELIDEDALERFERALT